jgi:hypothetical protein
MLKRVETETALSFADLRVSHENRAVVLNGKTYIMLGANALKRDEWPILREAAHGILAARKAGDHVRAAQLEKSIHSLIANDGEKIALYQLAGVHAQASQAR